MNTRRILSRFLLTPVLLFTASTFGISPLSAQTNLNQEFPNSTAQPQVTNTRPGVSNQLAPGQDEIKTGNYYENLAIQRRHSQDEIHTIANEPNKDYSTPKVKPANTSSKFERLSDTGSLTYKASAPFYRSAATEIENMLAGKTPLDLKRAIFVTENAYYGNRLDYNSYLKQIAYVVRICKELLQKKGYSPTDKLACNYIIQSLYSDTIKTGKSTLYPFTYDFNDFMGDNNLSNLFVTKLLNTGKGQCHSLPLLYLILANELNTDAFLALAPAHSYIKFPLGMQLCGFECTCGRPTDDKFMTASGYISSMAIANKLYLAPQSPIQTIAQCLVDLSTEYALTFGYDDFVISVCQVAAHYNPACVSAMQNISNAVTLRFEKLVAQYGYPPKDQIGKYPDLAVLYNEMHALYNQLDNKGYLEIPAEQYAQWLSSANTEQQKKMQAQLKNKLNSYLENKSQ